MRLKLLCRSFMVVLIRGTLQIAGGICMPVHTKKQRKSLEILFQDARSNKSSVLAFGFEHTTSSRSLSIIKYTDAVSSMRCADSQAHLKRINAKIRFRSVYGFWRVSEPAPSGCLFEIVLRGQGLNLERAKGFEPSTPTLAKSLCQALPLFCSGYFGRFCIRLCSVYPLRQNFLNLEVPF